jgi:hypothetical protein
MDKEGDVARIFALTDQVIKYGGAMSARNGSAFVPAASGIVAAPAGDRCGNRRSAELRR